MEDSENNEILLLEEPKKINKLLKTFLFVGVLVIFFILGTIFYIKDLSLAPNNFPTGAHITIEQGTEVKKITEILEDEGIVKSKMLLYYILVFAYEPKNIKASEYVFGTPMTIFEVAKKLTEGDFDTNLIRFTHFEGERAIQIAEKAEETLPDFDKKIFIERAVKLEGKLFPDTYLIPPTYNENDLIDLMLQTFTDKTERLKPEIEDHDLNFEQILVLASIIEREANDEESMRFVSSVLQNRLESGMALQADASIEYVLDKPLSELTPEDLEIDSPYNTYLNPGLPPTPIGNPGLDSIKAVLEPADSDYFYYITDADGMFHFAKTYKEHLNNIEVYLK